jgi:hypothetical protein
VNDKTFTLQTRTPTVWQPPNENKNKNAIEGQGATKTPRNDKSYVNAAFDAKQRPISGADKKTRKDVPLCKSQVRNQMRKT